MAKLIHTMIRVRDLPRALQFYQTAFNFDVSHRLDFPEFTL
ncbi:MAG TPA: VOC family protein, partial [Paraburkholderia sp.]|nr:VOC family protein [Paraburkholderia sp.]